MHRRYWMVIYLQQLCNYYCGISGCKSTNKKEAFVFCFRLQVRAQVQTAVAAVHRRQQHRLSLPHGSQPLAGGPHGNDPDRSCLQSVSLQLLHICIDACWITAPSVGTLKNWIFYRLHITSLCMWCFMYRLARSSCFLSGGGEERHMFMDSCARMQKKTLSVNTARLCDATQIDKNWCAFIYLSLNYSVMR